MEVVDFKEVKREYRKKAVKNWFHDRALDAKVFWNNNKDFLIVAVPAGLTALTTISKVVVKRNNLKKEQKLKDCYCYDRSLGHYWALKRDLTNKEWLEIDQRKKNGERLSDILDELKVLK